MRPRGEVSYGSIDERSDRRWTVTRPNSQMRLPVLRGSLFEDLANNKLEVSIIKYQSYFNGQGSPLWPEFSVVLFEHRSIVDCRTVCSSRVCWLCLSFWFDGRMQSPVSQCLGEQAKTRHVNRRLFSDLLHLVPLALEILLPQRDLVVASRNRQNVAAQAPADSPEHGIKR